MEMFADQTFLLSDVQDSDVENMVVLMSSLAFVSNNRIITATWFSE